MQKGDILYQTYLDVLKKELVPAMGCTEPVTIAYCAALARKTLGAMPDSVFVSASGNVIKNVKSVVVPNTGGMKGIAAAAAAGIVAGDPERQLEVIAGLNDSSRAEIQKFLDSVPIKVSPAAAQSALDMTVTLASGASHASVRIADYLTNVVRIEKDGSLLMDASPVGEDACHEQEDPLTMEGIYDFVQAVAMEDVKDILDLQIRCNTQIAEEGLRGSWGANIGRVLLSEPNPDLQTRAKAMAAAGSDARMDGCALPVVINSGSGNQGLTVSLPVIEYARETGAGDETLYRALTLSNLTAIHQKYGIGRLSAFCGAVSAGAAAGAGIAYLLGGDFKVICHTVVNALAITSGIVCDGAKPSCAAKIAASVDAGILGYRMYKNGQQFRGGDGILSKGIENTLHNIVRLSKDGMQETDREIIRIMAE
jgi:L-cysteine desulfidase